MPTVTDVGRRRLSPENAPKIEAVYARIRLGVTQRTCLWIPKTVALSVELLGRREMIPVASTPSRWGCAWTPLVRRTRVLPSVYPQLH